MRRFVRHALGCLIRRLRRNQSDTPVQPVGPNDGFRRRNDTPPFADPRDQLDANEFFEAVQSRTQHELHVIDVAEDMVQRKTTRRLTQDGFETIEESSLLRTVYGRLVTPDQLVGGGRCMLCNGYADATHFLICAVCGCGLCIMHVAFIDGAALCPTHARQVLDRLDTWRRDP